MKKTLIALAVLTVSGASFAQSSVQIDGQYDAGYQALNYKGVSVNAFGGNGSTTSQINFRGSEDLGGGLKAEFRVETDWNTVSNNANTGAKKADGTVAAASAFGNGELRAGLVGGFGRVDFGAINNAQLDAYLTGQPFGTAVGSAFRGVFSTDAASAMSGSVVRFDNSARYITPVFNGFSATALGVQKNTKANSTNFSTTTGNFDYAGVQEFSLRYNNGPINAIYATTKQTLTGTEGATINDATNNTLGANYNFGNFTVYLLNQTAKSSVASGTPVDRSVTTVSGKYVMGQNVFIAQAGTAKNNIAGVTNTGNTSIFSLGYDYNLSKMTSIYARYEKLGDKAGLVSMPTQMAGFDSTDRTRTAVGLRVGF